MGSRFEDGVERPRAVCEHLLERMVAGGADRICFVISPGKTDIMRYFGGRAAGAEIVYAVQPEPAGLCDALFRACPVVRDDDAVAVGLPDTVWFPERGLTALPRDRLAFLLFQVAAPRNFDGVLTDAQDRVTEIEVKAQHPRTDWIWGAFTLPGHAFHALHALWREPGRGDEYVGPLVNAWLARGGQAVGVRAGETYVDVGTLGGYREALRLLEGRAAPPVG